jgi:hypothetical protein
VQGKVMVLCQGATAIDSVKNKAENSANIGKIALKLACGMRDVNYLSN